MSNIHTTSFERGARSERGAILVHVGLALLILMGFTAFVLDDGVLYLARRQAQNAADAGALAGAVALAYDSYDDRTASGPAHLSAVQAATSNLVMGSTAGVHADQALDASTFETLAPATCLGAPGSCVQVDVYRDGSHGSTTLPTFFAQLWGITSQVMRATATAQVRSANASECLKPWMAPDKSETTTYTMADVGTLLILRDGTGPSQYQQADYADWCQALGEGGGAACYRYSITHCIAIPPNDPIELGDPLPNKTGRTQGGQAAGEVFNQDPGATWNPVTKSVENSCAMTQTCMCANTPDGCANGLNGTVSPRLLAVGVYKPSALAQGPGQWTAPLSNIVGFFLLEPGVGDPNHPDNAECVEDSENVCGYLTTIPGEINSGGSVPATGETLNIFVSLVR